MQTYVAVAEDNIIGNIKMKLLLGVVILAVFISDVISTAAHADTELNSLLTESRAMRLALESYQHQFVDQDISILNDTHKLYRTTLNSWVQRNIDEALNETTTDCEATLKYKLKKIEADFMASTDTALGHLISYISRKEFEWSNDGIKFDEKIADLLRIGQALERTILQVKTACSNDSTVTFEQCLQPHLPNLRRALESHRQGDIQLRHQIQLNTRVAAFMYGFGARYVLDEYLAQTNAARDEALTCTNTI